MNLQQAKITLEKINRLYQSMTLDNSIDTHEQQLMLIYIRQLHKAFSGEALIETSSATVSQPTVSTQTTTSFPKPSLEVIEPVSPARVSTKIVRETPVIKTEVIEPQPTERPTPPTPERVVEKRIIEEPVAQERVVVKETPRPTVQEEKVIETPKPQPSYTPPVQEKVVSSYEDDNNEYDELFYQKEAKELSDRLTNRPIANLTKALSINERILTCNELFKKDNNLFNEALIKLNSFGSFKEARPYLAQLAGDLGWNTKEKKTRAQIFIKLVRRRYL